MSSAKAYHNGAPTQAQTSAHPSAVVVEDGDLRTYRIELPNTLDDSDLSVYAFRLYAHLKRRAGANGGACFEGTRRMAAHCRMSVGKIVAAKRELEAAGLITVDPGDARTNTPDSIRIVDIWAENFRRYAPASAAAGKGRRPARHATRTPVHRVNTPVHEAAPPCSPGERKKEPAEERTNEERTHTQRARAAEPGASAAAGVSVSPSKSVFSFAERKAHAAAYGLGPGWLTNSRDGRYDEIIADARAATQPAAIEQSLRAQPRPRMGYRDALLHLKSIIDINAHLDIAGAVAQLDVSDADRAQLLAYDYTNMRAAAAAGGEQRQ
jgi:hypothetical protein